jgi:protein-disulfide isomerase
MRTRVRLFVLLLTLPLALGWAGDAYSQSKPDAGEDAEVVATINGQKKITLKEVDASAGSELQGVLDRLSAIRRRALNNLITKILLEEEARARGLTLEQLSKQLVPERVEIEQKKVDDVYLIGATRYPSLSEEEAKQRIKLDLENRAKFEAFQKAVADVRSKAKVEITLREPVTPSVKVSDIGPTKGASDAAVTIVGFSDFQCPFCKEANQTLKQLLANSRGNVRFVFKHLPLSNHQWAFQAAQASVCAESQGKFWEYHDRLFERSIDLSADALKRYAADLGLNADKFNACMASEASRAAVLKDMEEAKRAGVIGTPTFIMNGRVLRGAKSLEEFSAAVEQELKKNNPGGSAQTQVRRTGK